MDNGFCVAEVGTLCIVSAEGGYQVWRSRAWHAPSGDGGPDAPEMSGLDSPGKAREWIAANADVDTN